MDPHFHEYLAVIEAMQELYGHRCDEQPTEVHDAQPVVVPAPVPVVAA